MQRQCQSESPSLINSLERDLWSIHIGFQERFIHESGEEISQRITYQDICQMMFARFNPRQACTYRNCMQGNV